MRCETSEIDIETVKNRIENGDINLQPEFQRGEVWPMGKKKVLIDTILREWRIPPIHVVRNGETAQEEVLDGQQRLASIRDFLDDRFPVDGGVAPYDEGISELGGLRFSELPISIQRKIKQYPLALVRLTDYSPEEPAELFNRLNQPSTLTSAERRNAYLGPTRNQIRALVSYMEGLGADKDIIGFSNSRYAYDEVVSKFAYAVESATLRKKIVASDISNRYRTSEEFSENTISICKRTLHSLVKSLVSIHSSGKKIRLNKATMFSWMVFIKSNSAIDEQSLSETLRLFEEFRAYFKGNGVDRLSEEDSIRLRTLSEEYHFLVPMLTIFGQKASMGSTDVASIIHRDIIINTFFFMLYDTNNKVLVGMNKMYTEKPSSNYVLEKISEATAWGEPF